MAYKADNETREILGTFEKNKRGDYVQVTAITDSKGDINYDIRNMYTNDADELCFTSKGIRVKKDMLIDIFAAVLNHLDADTYNAIISKVETDEVNQ